MTRSSSLSGEALLHDGRESPPIGLIQPHRTSGGRRGGLCVPRTPQPCRAPRASRSPRAAVGEQAPRAGPCCRPGRCPARRSAWVAGPRSGGRTVRRRAAASRSGNRRLSGPAEPPATKPPVGKVLKRISPMENRSSASHDSSGGLAWSEVALAATVQPSLSIASSSRDAERIVGVRRLVEPGPTGRGLLVTETDRLRRSRGTPRQAGRFRSQS